MKFSKEKRTIVATLITHTSGRRLNLPYGSYALPTSISLTRINTKPLLIYFFVFKNQIHDQFRKLKLSPSDNYWCNTNDLECHYLKSQDIRRKFVSIRVLIKNWSRKLINKNIIKMNIKRTQTVIQSESEESPLHRSKEQLNP